MNLLKTLVDDSGMRLVVLESFCIWVFPKIGGNTPKWMVKIMENPIKMDDLGVPLFLEAPIYNGFKNTHVRW